nr:DUF87 domain-containing protein [uncultured Schaedlerella sp.]
MYRSYVGQIVGEKDVFIRKDSPNQHIIITGISGSGKSVRIADLESNIIEQGGTILAFDMDGTHLEISHDICHFISAQEDGLEIKLLDTTLVEAKKETTINLVQYIMETICPREMHGAVQLGIVRKAIQFAIHNRDRYVSDMEAILDGLKEQDGPAAVGAYNHLCPILESNIFRYSTKKIEANKVNIISLQGINPKTQKRVVEIMLSILWRKMRIEGTAKQRFTLVLDEFQNFDFQQGTILFQMLTEIRKYGVQLILSTQTLSIFNKRQLAVINQAATKLFFAHDVTDAKKMAGLIETKNKEKWTDELSHLKVGKAVTVGSLEIAGRPVNHPIITSSHYGEMGNLMLKI